MSSESSQKASFLRAIIARPDDDLPRLIYADWLEENGQTERAEFIRVQCELARLDPYHRSCTGDKCPGCSALRRRAWELLIGARWGRWVGLEPGRVSYVLSTLSPPGEATLAAIGPRDIGVYFRRGFVEEIACRALDFVHYHKEILAATPLRVVRFPDYAEAASYVWASKLPHIRFLPSREDEMRVVHSPIPPSASRQPTIPSLAALQAEQ